MNKKTVFIILSVLLFTTIVISLYSTFAYDEESKKLEASNANYNLVYSIKDQSNHEVSVGPDTTKYVDIVLKNTYKGIVKYGMYYKLLKPNKMPDNVNITLAEESTSKLQDIINIDEEKTITIKIVNKSDYNLDLVIGALVGFENGNIEELINDGENLIK